MIQNDQLVIDAVRDSGAAGVLVDALAGHWPGIHIRTVGAQRGHVDLWQVCPAHQLRGFQYATEVGDTIFAACMKTALPRAVALARQRKKLSDSIRWTYRRRSDGEMKEIMGPQPTNRHWRRLRKRYAKVHNELSTFLEHPDAPPDNHGRESE